MQLQSLKAISPIDGRYRSQLQHLSEYFSEFALMRYRVKVEIEYFLFLAEKKFCKLTPSLKKQISRSAAGLMTTAFMATRQIQELE